MNKNNLQTLKGFRDFLPREALKREWLKNEITTTFKIWGFDPMETPTLEPLEIFAGQVGEDEKLFYKFQDPGGRDVALRYDQTVPAGRVIGGNYQSLPMPFRRYQIQPAFRAEKPQKGRYRELLQCDADIFGSASVLADAEVIGLSLDVYRRLGFPKAVVEVNDRELLKELPYKAIVAIDKLKKVGPQGVIKEMVEKGIKKEVAEDYLSYVENLKPNEKIITIFKYLKDLGFAESWYVFSPTLARSFSYSTGPIWEVNIPGYETGAVLGGERYDNLIEKITGVSVAGTGFGLGFDRTLEAAELFKLVPDFVTDSQVLITVFSPEILSDSIQLAGFLRQNGINTELYPNTDAKLEKQFKYADKKGIKVVLTVGPEEIKEKKINIKNLKTGEQGKVVQDGLITAIHHLIDHK